MSGERREHADVLVLGAGPAGISAALAAAEQGLTVALFDESPAAGGQVYRAPPEGFTVRDARAIDVDFSVGQSLRQRLADSPVRCRLGCRVWDVQPGVALRALGTDGPEVWDGRAIVVAAGTHEIVVPFRGWTLPGVIGLGAATILLKAQQVVPSGPLVVAGAGPLLVLVAKAALAAGGKVAAIVDLASPGDWLRMTPAMAMRPDLLLRGAGWMARLRAARIPILSRHTVIEARGAECVEEVTVAPVDDDGRPIPGGRTRTFGVGLLAVGHGLAPAVEATRLLRVAHGYHPERGGWVPIQDTDGRSSEPGIYVAGDCAGVAGASAAVLHGRLVGLAVARDQGRMDARVFEMHALRLRPALWRARTFGGASAWMMRIRDGLVDAIPPDVVVCRCEDISRADIDTALTAGVRHMNQLKAWTRCGMGPCQGRMCGETVYRLVTRALGSHETAGTWATRAPLRPVSMAALLQEFDYRDIPRPGDILREQVMVPGEDGAEAAS